MLRTCKKVKGMPLLVSEFGLCEPAFKGGDEERSRILKERLAMYAEIPNICGYMWFSLNDYRTHCGEEGEDKLRRRIHGSTDLYGNEKPSYRLLCDSQKNK
jgi:beta-glucuronidase